MVPDQDVRKIGILEKFERKKQPFKEKSFLKTPTFDGKKSFFSERYFYYRETTHSITFF
jgi:hypothetical protein